MNDSAAKICGHRCPAHPDWMPCQLPPAHNPTNGHRDSAGDDVQHVWQHHGHDIQAESTAIMLNAASASWSRGQPRLLVCDRAASNAAAIQVCSYVGDDLLKPRARGRARPRHTAQPGRVVTSRTPKT